MGLEASVGDRLVPIQDVRYEAIVSLRSFAACSPSADKSYGHASPSPWGQSEKDVVAPAIVPTEVAGAPIGYVEGYVHFRLHVL